MADLEFLSFRAGLPEYEVQAETLFRAAKSGDVEALWKFKWQHPRFRGKGIEDVRNASLEIDDARWVIAREYAFENWDDLVKFAAAIQSDAALQRFETAVEAVIHGDMSQLGTLIESDPELVRARSARRHHGTLLHYVAANGVENGRQRTPPNAVEIAQLLLDKGAEVDALADMYDAQCTTMSMLLSSCHPAHAGVQVQLAELLLDHGALMIGPGTNWKSSVMTALSFGYLPAAQAMIRRGAPIEDVSVAAGVGRLEEVRKLYPAANPLERQTALALAAQHGHADVVTFLLDQGEDPNRFNPEGHHSHSTPLHQAIAGGHLDVVKLLVGRGARPEIQDTLYGGTALGWAEHCEHQEIAAWLRNLTSAPTSL